MAPERIDAAAAAPYQTHAGRTTAVHGAFFCTVAVICSILIASFEYPPLADYLDWMYQARVLAHWVQTGSLEHFYVRDYPVPYMFAQVVMTALDLLLGPQVAGQATIALYGMVGAVIIHRFVQHWGLVPQWAYPLLLISVLFNSSFWSGYINYQCGLLVLMAWLSLDRVRRQRPLMIAAFGLLAFTCHGFCLLAFGIIVAGSTLDRGPRAFLPATLGMLPAALLTLWYFAAKHNDAMHLTSRLPDTPGTTLAYKIYTFSKTGPYHNFFIAGLGDAERLPWLLILGVAVNLAWAVILLCVVLRFLRSAPDRALRWSAMAMLLAFLLAPSIAMDVVNPGERLLYPALLCMFAQALRANVASQPASPRHGRIGDALHELASLGTRAFGSLAPLLSLGVLMLLACLIRLALLQPVPPEVALGEPNRKDILGILYWHRPYQGERFYRAMMESYRTREEPKLPLGFPTSVLGAR